MIKFVAIGPPKCGTTFLQNILIQNPDIFLSDKKEIQFFNYNYDKGSEWYHEHFRSMINGQLAGEISPTYSDSFETLRRLKEYQEANKVKLKIILTYRDPIKRLISEYYHHIRRTNYSISLQEAVEAELAGDKNKYYCILRNSKYGEILTEIYSLFEKENVMIIDAENELYNQNVNKTIEKLEAFLNVQHFTNYNFDVDNNASYVPKSQAIQTIVFKDNILKNIFRWIIPSFKLRSKIRKLIRNYNTEGEGYDKSIAIDKSVIDNIFQKHIKDDYKFFLNTK